MKTHLAKKRNTKNESKQTEELKLFTSGIIIELMAFLLSCVFALIFDIKSRNYYAVCVGALAVGSAVSGFLSGRKIKKRGLLNGVLYALPANFLFLLLSLIFNNFKPDFFMPVSLLILLAFSAFGGIISMNIRFAPKINKKR